MKTEILSGPERRRRWSAAEKELAVAEALVPGANVAAIARRLGVSRSLVYTWRREARPEPSVPAMPALVPVIVAPGDGADAPSKDHERPGVRSGSARSRHGVGSGVIEIALAGGARVDEAARKCDAWRRDSRSDRTERSATKCLRRFIGRPATPASQPSDEAGILRRQVVQGWGQAQLTEDYRYDRGRNGEQSRT